jgi:uncharacterized membrane protein
MGELSPTTGLIIVALITAVPTVTAIFVSDRRAAKRDAAAARLVAGVAVKAEEAAELVAGVAEKTEQVKTHLEESNTVTTGKLDSIECKADQIHDLVNNKFSEQLKLNLFLANKLLAEKPDDVDYQHIAKRAAEAVESHQPAESTTREAKGA